MVNKRVVPPTSEEIRVWRRLCEDLDKRPYKSAYGAEVPYAWLLLYDCRRDALQDLHGIVLIFYGSGWGWRLRKNWQQQLEFLEKVYLEGADPNTLPQPWRSQ